MLQRLSSVKQRLTIWIRECYYGNLLILFFNMISFCLSLLCIFFFLRNETIIRTLDGFDITSRLSLKGLIPGEMIDADVSITLFLLCYLLFIVCIYTKNVF